MNEKSQNVNKLLVPRTQKYKQMIRDSEIPTSTKQCIIVPCLARSFGFKTNQFNKQIDHLAGNIDKKEFDKFVRTSNRIIDDELSKKALKEKQPFFKVLSFFLRFNIILGALSFILLSIIVYGEIPENISEIILTISIILIVFAVIIASLCPVFLYRAEYKEHDYQQKIKMRLESWQSQANKALQADNKPLFWKFQEDFLWIELRLTSQNRKQCIFFENQISSPPLIQ